jgi:hypothetical protein
MKLTKSLLATVVLAAGMALTGCDNDTNGDNYLDYTFSFQGTDDTYTTDGYWAEVFNTADDYKYINAGYAYFSHEATYWDDYDYTSWYGFCPSRATNTDEMDASSDVTSMQWSSASGSGLNSTDYMLAYWNVMEDTTTIPANPTLKITFVAAATPSSIYVNNSNYGYWTMKKGNYFAKAFGDDDWFKVTFIGVKDNAVTGSVDAYLAEKGEIVKTWKAVDLTPLGTVDYIYIQMSSTDNSAYGYGMNNPAYVCLDNLSVRFTY